MLIQTKYNNIEIDVSIPHGVSVFSGDSGNGKSYLFRILKSYCQDNYDSFLYLNYDFKDITFEKFKVLSKDIKLFLLDNADLYMTSEIWNYLLSLDCYCMIVLRHLSEYSTSSINYNLISYSNNKLKVRQLS